MIHLRKQNFIKGSIILMLSAAAAKLLGAFFKIPLTNILGGVGMSYFSCAYSIFMPVYSLTVTGLTAAVARMTAKAAASGDSSQVQSIRRTALILFSLAGLCGSAAIATLARPFSILSVGNTDAQAAIIMIAPTVFFGCITAVERGYCEGMSNMYPTAISQVIEGAVKVAAGLWLCGYVTAHPDMLHRFFPDISDIRAGAAAAGILGVTLSSVGAWLFFAVMALFSRERRTSSSWSVSTAKELTRTALPTGISAVVTNLTALIDMWTVIGCLRPGTAGVSGISAEDIPHFVYGSFSGIALTVFNLVPSVTNMLGKGALTCVTSAYESGDRTALRNSTVQALIVSAVIAVPASVGMGVLSREVLDILYPMQSDEVMICVQPLRLLMPGMVCLCVSYPLFSMLQAVGKPSLPLKIMLMGTALKLAGNLLLIPVMGAEGAALSTSLCYGAILLVSLITYLRAAEIKLSLPPFAKVLYSGAVCGGMAYLAASFMRRNGASDIAVLLASAVSGGAAYTAMLYILMGVRTQKKKPAQRQAGFS